MCEPARRAHPGLVDVSRRQSSRRYAQGAFHTVMCRALCVSPFALAFCSHVHESAAAMASLACPHTSIHAPTRARARTHTQPFAHLLATSHSVPWLEASVRPYVKSLRQHPSSKRLNNARPLITLGHLDVSLSLRPFLAQSSAGPTRPLVDAKRLVVDAEPVHGACDSFGRAAGGCLGWSCVRGK